MPKDTLNTNPGLPMSIIYILISLAGGELNLNQINRAVVEHSQGRLRLSESMLRRRLAFVMRQKWIERDPVRKSGKDYPLTVPYRLLPLGRQALADQLAHLEEIANLLKTALHARTRKPFRP